MTRSYNSRKGHYGCKCRRFDQEWREPWSRSKNNRKRKAIKFDGILYRYKTKIKMKNKLEYRTEPIYNEAHEIVRWKWVVSDCDRSWFRDFDKFISDREKEARQSYINWTWLKGKSNVKRWSISNRYTVKNGKWARHLYPCQ